MNWFKNNIGEFFIISVVYLSLIIALVWSSIDYGHNKYQQGFLEGVQSRIDYERGL
jgi:hypothetical protein